MLNAIGPFVFPQSAVTGTSTAGLEAQIDQYKIKLVDWVNCPSCKTPEGKAKISDISNKINNIQARIEKIAVAKSNVQPAEHDSRAISANRNVSVSGVQNNVVAAAFEPAVATVGSLLDVFA